MIIASVVTLIILPSEIRPYTEESGSLKPVVAKEKQLGLTSEK
jgi:hypothetical protein